MFFLKLKGKDLECLLSIAQQTGVQIEKLARRAFLNGLSLLVRTDTNNTNNTAINHYTDEDRQRHTRQEAVAALHDYIGKNWEHKTDAEIAETLGYSSPYIKLIRIQLGFVNKRGRKQGSRKNESLKYQRLDELIQEHWQTKSDAAIGRLMNPPMARISIIKRRLRLGLQKERGGRRTNVLRQKIDPEEFERLVIHGGYTAAEYIRLQNLHCTKERLRQVVEEMGLKHSPAERAPEWIVMRTARRAGNLNLANREWLAEKMAGAGSMATLAAELAIAERDLFFLIRSFKLTHPSFRKHGLETETLVCAACGKTFERLKRWTKKRREQAKNGEILLEFFCSQSCAGKHNKKRRARGQKTAKEVERDRRKSQRSESTTAFVREHWQTMSDVEIASALKISHKTVKAKRSQLKIYRR